MAEMLGNLKDVINASFVKFTGYECEDVSAKLALLSLQHPASMAIKEKFESLKWKFYGEGETAMPIPELLSWDTGRFGGTPAFIVDRIQGRSIEVRGIVRVIDGESRRRNDCCGSGRETWSICPGCKVCFCAACFCHKGWYRRQRCACYMSTVGWPFQWGIGGRRFWNGMMSQVA